MHDQPGLETKNRDCLSTHFDATNLVAVLEFPNELFVKCVSFEVSRCTILCENSVYTLLELCFENEHTPELVFTRRVQF